MAIESVTSFPKNRIKVLLLESIDPGARVAFEAQGFPVETMPKGIRDEDELVEKIKDVFVLGIRSATQVTPRVLANARRLLAVGAFCIGTDQIDLTACSESGVAVFNDTFSNGRSVAEFAMGGIVMLTRRVFKKSTLMHQGIWDKSIDGAREVRGRTLGIIGYGRIGKQLSVLAESYGMDVSFYNTSDTYAMGNAKKRSSMEEVLAEADVVSVHVSGKDSNDNLFSDREFSLMKEGAAFLNMSRGFVVDTAALARAIKSSQISGAVMDVHPDEPAQNGPGYHSVLQDLPNVILTPHIAGNSLDAQELIGVEASKKLIRFINTGDTTASVNWPEVQPPPEEPGMHRFLHFHRNVPRVLQNLYRIIGDRDINIGHQRSAPRGEYAYAIVNVGAGYNKDLLDEIRAVPDTIKFRSLY